MNHEHPNLRGDDHQRFGADTPIPTKIWVLGALIGSMLFVVTAINVFQ